MQIWKNLNFIIKKQNDFKLTKNSTFLDNYGKYFVWPYENFENFNIWVNMIHQT